MKKYLKILVSGVLVVLFLFSNKALVSAQTYPSTTNPNTQMNVNEGPNNWNDGFVNNNISQPVNSGFDYSNLENKNRGLYGANPRSEKEISSLLLAGLGIAMGILGIAVALGVLILVSMWKIYKKAGKSGWAGIIPIYNWIVMLEIVGKPMWWIVLFFISPLNIVFFIWTHNLLAKSFGKNQWFTAGLVLLPFIFFPILAFGDAKYTNPTATASMPHSPESSSPVEEKTEASI